MYSYRPPHIAGQKQDDQLKHTYSSYVRIRDVALKTCQRRWTIGRSGERGSGISVLATRHDDDDDFYLLVICMHTVVWLQIFLFNTNNFQSNLFWIGHKKIQPLQVRVNVVKNGIKVYSPEFQCKSLTIRWNLQSYVGIFLLCGDAVSVFWAPQ